MANLKSLVSYSVERDLEGNLSVFKAVILNDSVVIDLVMVVTSEQAKMLGIELLINSGK